MEEKDLPKGWSVVRLGDYAETEKGKKPKNLSKEKTSKYSIPYVNIKAFEKNVIDEFTDGKGCVLCEKDDFLMVWDGSRSGYVGKAIEGALGSTLVRIKLPKVNHDFAFYFLKSKFKEINTRAKGVGIPHVDPNIVWNYKFPLPPFQVQAQIVSKIDEFFSELDNGIEQLKTAKEQLKVYRQSVLKWAFEGKLTNKNVKDGELPKGWKMEMLGDIAEVKRGKSKHRPRNDKKLFGGTYPFIQTGEVKAARGGTIRKYTETYSEMGLEQSKLWPKGTLCLTIAANIADTAFLGFDACFPDSIVGIITNKEKLLIKYINFYVQNLKVKIDSEASATAQKNINVEFLDKMKIPLPGIEEQDKIVNEIESRLSVCDKVEETIETALKQSESLRQSILKKAFEGKLI